MRNTNTSKTFVSVLNKNKCLGSCTVTYGGRYEDTAGFEMHSCSSDKTNIQNSSYVGFWCDWSSGKYRNVAVMMIGGGGEKCNGVDHGIGIGSQKRDEQKFKKKFDFGTNAKSKPPSNYSLNLWVR